MRLGDFLRGPNSEAVEQLPSSWRTPMMLHYIEMKRQAPHAFLFYRMGDFYEMFFEDAEEVSKLLDLTLTARNKNDEHPIPMCGVPCHSVSGYIQRLTEKGFRVAICDQLEDAKNAKGMVKRGITRTITPAMVLDPMESDHRRPFYVDGCFRVRDEWVHFRFDVTSAQLQIQGFESESELLNVIQKFTPQELLVWDEDVETLTSGLRQADHQGLLRSLFRVRKPSSSNQDLQLRLKSIFDGRELEAFGFYELPPDYFPGLVSLLGYIKDHEKTRDWGSFQLLRANSKEWMNVDAQAYRHLEIFESQDRENPEACLMGVFDEVVTGMGRRHLQARLLEPHLSIAAIESHHQPVRWFMERPLIREQWILALKNVWDLERLSQKISNRTVNPPNLDQVRRSLETLLALIEGSDEGPFADLGSRLRRLGGLLEMIGQCLKDSPSLEVGSGGVIRDGFNPELDECRRIQNHSELWLKDYEAREREQSKISTLKVKYNRVFGFSIEVSKAQIEKVPIHFQRRQTLANGERYVTKELLDFEKKWLQSSELVREIEQRLFEDLSRKVQMYARDLLELGRLVGAIDVSQASAGLCLFRKYQFPEFTSEDSFEIVEGRHPVLERLSQQPFIPNSIHWTEKERFIVLTGPNMAGKSTLMRQTGLIILLAQAGLPVPARRARLGIVHQLLSRVGASDRLARGQSTFMVEMVETASILRKANERSLVLIDEIGRGTSTNDGMSLAWAVAEHLIQKCRSWTFFATHYHELTALEDSYDGVRCGELAIKEYQGSIHFLRLFRWGACERSYGLNVARLAGLPSSVLESAEKKLREYDQMRPQTQMRLI